MEKIQGEHKGRWGRLQDCWLLRHVPGPHPRVQLGSESSRDMFPMSTGGGQTADKPDWASCSFPAVLRVTQGAPGREHDIKAERDLKTGAHKKHKRKKAEPESESHRPSDSGLPAKDLY